MYSVLAAAAISLTALSLCGCDGSAPSRADELSPKSDSKTAGGYDTDVLAKRIAESMAKLSPEDRKLAEAQKFCPVGVVFDKDGKPESGFLGAIGKPVKIMVKDQPVFIMCPSCTEEFKNETGKYMQVLAKIRASQQTKKK